MIELDSVFLNLFEFGDDFSFSQIFQDLHVVNSEDLSDELPSGFSTSQGIGVSNRFWTFMRAFSTDIILTFRTCVKTKFLIHGVKVYITFTKFTECFVILMRISV